MNEYICLNCDFSNKKEKRTTFNNEFGLKPYTEGKKLYIPVEMLNKKYKNYYNIKPKQNSKESEEEEEEKEEEEEGKEEEGKEEEEKKDDNKLMNLNEIKPTGLVNIGGICYLNAVLQCFFYCRPLTEYFLDLKNLKYFKDEKLRPISNGYYELVKGLSSGNTYAATKFRNALMKADDTFIGTEGKDSKDVAVLLLSEIDYELQDKKKVNNNYNANLDHTNLFKVYEEKKKMDNPKRTIITDTFNFLIKYEQTCLTTCPKYKKKYFNIESDNILIFDLEKIYNEDMHRNDRDYKEYPEISLEDCLRYYKRIQEMECPFCKNNSCNRSTLKVKKAICSLPKIFIFVMSRGYNIQFDCKITFNEELDMSKFYEGIRNNTNNTKYKLIGTTFAYDWTKRSKHTGHTVAFCKSYKGNEDNPQYYKFNDSCSEKAKIDDIKNKVPYLLFYQKCT